MFTTIIHRRSKLTGFHNKTSIAISVPVLSHKRLDSPSAAVPHTLAQAQAARLATPVSTDSAVHLPPVSGPNDVVPLLPRTPEDGYNPIAPVRFDGIGSVQGTGLVAAGNPTPCP
jgi:hypothetical protein